MNTMWVLAGLGLTGAFAAFYAIMSAAGGFGDRDSGWQEYCEAPRGRPIEQPFSFWSDLSFVVAGLAILLWVDTTESGNPAATATIYSVMLGLLTVWLGLGSMLEHGTLNSTWGWFDSSSIHWWALFVLVYVVFGWLVPPAQLLEPGVIAGASAAWLIPVILVGILTARNTSWRTPTSIVLMALLGVALVLDGVFENPPARRWWFLLGAGFLLLFGLLSLLGSRKGGFLCRDEAATQRSFQWHGMWHILTAATTFFVYVYLRLQWPPV